MSNEDVLEHSGQQEESSVDIADLLEIANSKVFDDQDGLTERKKNFEKVTSFFAVSYTHLTLPTKRIV